MTEAGVDMASAGSEPDPAAEPAGTGSAAPRRSSAVGPVVVGDLVLAVVALVGLVVIGLQRYDDATLASRQHAYVEALVVIFAVGAIFTAVAVALFRSRRGRVAVAQAVVAALVLGIGVAAAAAGVPKGDTSVTTPLDNPDQQGPAAGS